MQIREQRLSGSHILYDADRLAKPELRLFEPGWLREQALLLQNRAGGRGEVSFFRWQGCDYVLRHYRRGGLMARLFADRYLWSGFSRSRAWHEWRLLAQLYQQGLPVPRPLAAKVVRTGVFYRADLITARLLAEPLTARLRERALEPELWQRIGEVIRRFHRAGVYHDDLNADNILLGSEQRVWLIDFDKGSIRVSADGWQQANLQRLLRSLQKQQGKYQPFHFGEVEWQALLAGYAAQSIGHSESGQ